MPRLFCDTTSGVFVRGFRDPSLDRIVLPQSDALAVRIYLLQHSPHFGSAWPFVYHAQSGLTPEAAAIEIQGGEGPAVALAALDGLAAVQNGWSGRLTTNTDEVADYLAGYGERDAALTVQVNGEALFRSHVTLQARAAGLALSSVGMLVPRPDILDYTGGGPHALDGIATKGARLGRRYEVVINGAASSWQLVEGDGETEFDAQGRIKGRIRPLDYDPETNARNLIRVAGR